MLICVGQPVSLTAAGCGMGGTYAWSTGQTGPIITYTPQSTSLVSVTCVTSGGPRRGAPGAFEDGDSGAIPGNPGASEGDKPQGVIWRPARDPRGSGR